MTVRHSYTIDHAEVQENAPQQDGAAVCRDLGYNHPYEEIRHGNLENFHNNYPIQTTAPNNPTIPMRQLRNIGLELAASI